MILVPREYQEYARDATWGYFEAGNTGNPLILMPTGTGKSVVIGDLARSMLWAFPHTRIDVVTHVETLIAQNYEKALRVWPGMPAGIYSAGLGRYDTHAQVTFAGIQSIYRDPHKRPPPDLVFIDEAHLVSPKDETMYQAWIQAQLARNPKMKIIGLTATDWRLGLGKLTDGGIFTDVAVDMTTPAAWNWFIDQGYLSRLHSKKTILRLDDSGIAIQGGDYVLSQQQQQLDKEDLVRRAVEEMLYWGNAENRNCWMLFATGVKHCEHLAEMLESYGVPAIAIHSKSKNPGKLLDAFAAGEYRAAVSMNKLTTGVDIPQIDLMGVLRFTRSSSLWVQMLGRGTRCDYAPGFDLSTPTGRFEAMRAGRKPNGCRVCDFAHNTERLGPINDPVVSAPKGRKKASGQGAPVRVCPGCADYVHASKTSCPNCGHEFGMVLRIQGSSSDAEVMTRGEQPEPVVTRIPVRQVTYHYYHRRGSARPPTLRVCYFSEGDLPQRYEEWIAFEGEGTARNRAIDWWTARVPQEYRDHMPVPSTVAEAQEAAQWLKIPKAIHVWVNAPRPKVMGYDYEDGYASA